MDLLGGALPNVMFIIGMLAIGLGLGIELKVVSLNKEIDKTGRIGAMVVGAILVAGSLFIYLNPSLTNRNQVSPTTANATLAPIGVPPPAPTVVPSAISAPASLPTEALEAKEVPTVVPSAIPTATLVPTTTPIPTAVPPTRAPSALVPDVHNQSENEAQDTLKKVGLQARKVDQCNGSDQGDPQAKKHRVQCQNPAANTAVRLGTTVEYVLR